MTYRTLPPAPGSRRERRLHAQARLRAYRQVGTSLVVVGVAAGSFTSAGAANIADQWFAPEQPAEIAIEAITAPDLAVEVQTVTETTEIPFEVIEQPDRLGRAGSRTVVQAGVPGTEVATITITTVDGVEVSRSVGIGLVVTAAVPEIVSVGQLVIPPATEVEKGSNRELGQKMAADRGWTGDEWACLDNLWTRESHWSHTSANKSSGAYGIPQALPGDKMAAYGADWATNPATQIAWGLAYVEGRYGSPCGAWSHFQTKNWY